LAGSTKRLASRFYQVETGHCPTGQYLEWTRNQPTAVCWWCPYRVQTWEHVFKNCPEWKPQQKVLWAEVREETGRGRDRFKMRDLLADTRYSRAVLDFLSTTDVGRKARPRLRTTRRARRQSVNSGNGSREREEERRVEVEAWRR
jgi:hypothetical protein